MIKVGKKTLFKGEEVDSVIPLMKEVYEEWGDIGAEFAFRELLFRLYNKKPIKHLYRARTLCLQAVKKFYEYLDFLEGREKEYNLRSLATTHHEYLMFLKAVGEEEKFEETENLFLKQRIKYLNRERVEKLKAIVNQTK